MSLDDVAQKINTSLDVSMRAEIDGDRLVLQDQSGSTSGNIVVTDMGDGHAAEDLGIEGTGTGNTLTGAIVNTLGRGTPLTQLNDGRGVRTVSGQPDLRITAQDGTMLDISIGGLNTVGAVLDAINNATGNGGKIVASTVDKKIVLTDTTGGGGTLQVAALNSSKAAQDLGLDVAATGNSIQGRTLLASFDSVLLTSLRGGAGISLGHIAITDRAGNSATVDLTGAQSVQDIIDAINSNGTALVAASLKESGNGIQLIDNSNGTGSLVISDTDSTTAAELGIAGTFTTSTLNGANMQRQWVSENMLLSAYNGGRGVMLGKIRITNRAGETASLDLSSGALTIGDVIKKINALTVPDGGTGTKSLGVTASINANGDGLLLTDTTGAVVHKLTVEEDGGTTAADLNIKGEGGADTINGSFERTYSISANDTLSTLVDSINAPGFAVSAQILNDGSGAAPYRLSLTARNSGRAGRVVFDAGTTGAATRNLVESQDAVVFYGGNSGSNPLVISSSTNQISNLVKGLTLDLHSASESPVTVSVTRTADNVVDELNKFADTYNGLIDKMKELTKFDAGSMTHGVLLGEGTVQSVEAEMQSILYATVPGAGVYKSLTEVGLSASGSSGHLVLDEERFKTAFAANPEAVKRLFTMYEKGATTILNQGGTPVTITAPDKKGLGIVMEDHLNVLLDPMFGLLTLESKTLDTRTQEYQDRMDQMDKLLAAKRARLEQQFASMETVLAKLQSQQSALAGFSIIQPMQSAA